VKRRIHREFSTPGLLEETLAGTHGVEALRAMALNPLRHGVRELLAEQAPWWDGSTPRLIRTKYKPSRKLSAYYELSPGDPARHAAVAWTNESVQVLVSPDDPAMPQLAGLHDDAHLTDLLGFTGRIDTIRYRPAQRHVLRVSAPDRAVYVKIDKDDSGARAVPVAQALASRMAIECPGAGLAEPIGYSAADRAGLWRSSPGEPLWQRLGDPGHAERLTHLLGRAVRVLHDTPTDLLPPSTDEEKPRDVKAEVASTIRAGEHIGTLVPQLGSDFLTIVGAVVDGLAHVPTEAPTFTHGDLKSDNVLASEGQVRLLDLDRCGPADPALDLAKFAADLHWWCAPDSDRARALSESFRAGYGECDPSRWHRAALLTRLFDLKLTARRCAVHYPAWDSHVRARVAAAAPVLARGA
jgi:aminoglycoside phosphotransferase (APT) family kinase protein